jgi:transcriptional regulator, tetR
MQELQDGSFYQYFEDKEDLLSYLMKEKNISMDKTVEKAFVEKKGDIFEIFIAIYDYIMQDFMKENEIHFFQKIFENMKTSEDNLFSMHMKDCPKPDIEKYFSFIDTSKFKQKEKEDVKIIVKMLYVLTKKAVVSSFQYQSKQQAREDYLKQIEFLKYGILKSEN